MPGTGKAGANTIASVQPRTLQFASRQNCPKLRYSWHLVKEETDERRDKNTTRHLSPPA